MKSIVISLSLVALCSGFSAPAHADTELANLKPGFNVKTGMVTVSNNGANANNKSVVTIACKKTGGGGCPDPTPGQLAEYSIPGFAGRVAVVTPAIAGSHQFAHTISFFKDLNFSAGKYVFTVCADAGRDVKESSEGDNCSKYSFTKAATHSSSNPGTPPKKATSRVKLPLKMAN